MAIQPTTLLSPPPFPAGNHVDRVTQKQLLRPMYTQLQRGQLRSSTDVALATAKALRRVISGARYTTMEELTSAIRMTGAWLQEARRGEQAITNITLRTLHLLAEESGALLEQPGTSSAPSRSYSTMSTAPPTPAPLHSRATSYLGAKVVNASPAASPSPLASPPTAAKPQPQPLGGAAPPHRPAFFAHDSTFSISDLVAAGQNANTSQMTGLDSAFASAFPSGASTPAVHHRGSVSMDEGTVDEEAKEELKEDDGEEEDDEEDDDIDSDGSASDSDSAVPAHMSSSTSSLRKPSAAASSTNAFHLKPLLIQAVQELIDELESTRANVARDARDHVHSGEFVLTLGHSLTVETFLKQAARDRHFTLVVADAGASKAASLYTAALPRKKVRILSIPHSSIFTVLPRVTKVILSPHAVLANGGLLAPPGSAAMGVAAKVHSTPVLVLAGLHKVCGDWQWVGIASSGNGSGGPLPGAILSKEGLARASGRGREHEHGAYSTATPPTSFSSPPPAPSSLSSSAAPPTTPTPSISTTLAGDSYTRPPQSLLASSDIAPVQEVIAHEWDYVEPHLVDVLVTNTGEYPSSYVYRLIAENFVAA